MKLKWYGTASLLLESGGTRLLFDPYLKPLNPKLPALPVEEAKTAQAVFITHPHFDHFESIGTFAEGRDVYVSAAGAEHAARLGIPTERFHAIEAGGEYRVGNFLVRAYRSRHCRFDVGTVLRVLFSPRTYVCLPKSISILKMTKEYRIAQDEIFALEVTDGEKRVFVLGSAGLEPEEKYPQGADLLVYPYQGRSNMNRYMRRFLDAFRPKAVLTDHFDNAFPPFTHRVSVKRFPAALKKHLPSARAIVPTEGEWIEV